MATSTTKSLANNIASWMDNKVVRHTVGRIDSLLRTATVAGAIGLQTIKIVAKTWVILLTGFQGTKGAESWSNPGLKLDGAMLAALCYAGASTFRDTLAAPPKEYPSTLKTIEYCARILGGTHHDAPVPAGSSYAFIANRQCTAVLNNCTFNNFVSKIVDQ